MAEKKFERLPTDVTPVCYNLHLTPDLEAFTFKGTVTIDVNVNKATKVFKTNGADLEIQSAKIGEIEATSITLSQEDEEITYEFEEEIAEGDKSITIEFTGILNDKMKGFYRSKYKGEDGTERYMAVTQFESTDARRAFPCWDEPAHKAKFNVKLTVPKNRTSLSNMPIINTEEVDENTHTLSYDTTPIMSTYLLAFVIGEFDKISRETCNGRVLVSVYTPKGKSEQGEFALDVAARTLPYYEEWFGIEYPLPKSDLIAIPDFAAGAMENWGLITYRETALLVDPISTSAATKQWVALVVAHEEAHQWFGNLVTMEWWSQLWLNEGFASWVEYLCVDHLFPDWKIWTQFVYQDAGRAFSLDSLKSSHPIEVEVGHPSEVDEIFDIISYSKGSTVIRMLHSFLGEEAFKQGLHNYLKKFTYTNTVTEDLWEALSETSGKNVEQMMNTWTKQMGYPVVTISETEENNKFKVEQLRFLSSEIPSGADAEDYLWFIPLGFVSENGETYYTTLSEREGVVEIPDNIANSKFKLNPNQSSFYRVNYNNSPKLYNNIQDSILNGGFSEATDRIGVQNDAMALAKVGLLEISKYFDLVNCYKNEKDYTVWADLTSNLLNVLSTFGNEDLKDKFNQFGLELYSTAGEALGFEAKENESHLDGMLRSLVVNRLGRFGDAKTVEFAKNKLEEFVNDRNSLPADLRSAVYGIALKHGGEEQYNQVLTIFRDTDLQEEKVRCMRSLGSTGNVDLLKQTLDFSLSDEIRSQDAVFVIISVANNPKGSELAWQFLQDNWDKLYNLYQGGFLLSRLISGIISQFSTEEKALEIEAFFVEHPCPAGKRSISQGLETVRSNAQWINRDLDSVISYFSD